MTLTSPDTASVLAFQPSKSHPYVNVDQLIASRMLVQANSGAGKSRALRYMLEQTQSIAQHIVIDPEGEFATLREKFPYLLAGKDGDVPATPKTAKLLCRRLLETRASAVLDLYDLQLDERRAFVRIFLDELMHLPRALWHPLIVVLDEAHVFAPEKGHGDASSLSAVVSLATQGRKRGYCLVAATQRLSKFHKDTAAELLNKMIGRTGLDVDVKRAADELGLDKETRMTLRTLSPGTFYAYGPAVYDQHGDQVITLVRTGKVETTHPEAGKLAAPPPPAPAAVAKIVAQLRDIPKETDEELRTIDDFKRKNADLQRELKKAQSGLSERIVEKPVIDHAAVDIALAALVEQYSKNYGALKRHVEMIAPAWQTALRSMQPVIDDVIKACAEFERIQSLRTDAVQKRRASLPVGRTIGERIAASATKPLQWALPGVRKADGSRITGSTNGSLPVGERAVLTAIAQFDSPTREQISVTTGYKRSTRDAYIQRLIGYGHIELAQGGEIRATRAGINALGRDYEPLPTGADLKRYWLDKLPLGEASILEALCDVFPGALSRNELTTRTGYAPSTRNAYIQRLMARRLVTSSSLAVCAVPHLFD